MFSVVDEWESSPVALEDMAPFWWGCFWKLWNLQKMEPCWKKCFTEVRRGLGVWPYPSSCKLSAFMFVAEDMSS